MERGYGGRGQEALLWLGLAALSKSSSSGKQTAVNGKLGEFSAGVTSQRDPTDCPIEQPPAPSLHPGTMIRGGSLCGSGVSAANDERYRHLQQL